MFDSAFTLSETCTGATATITGDTGGTFAFNPIPTDSDIIDTATGTVSDASPGTQYFVEYGSATSCSSATILSLTTSTSILFCKMHQIFLSMILIIII